MKRTINLANAMCLIWSGTSSRTGFLLSGDAIERLLERVVLREIIVIDSSGKAVQTPERALRCDGLVIYDKQGWVNSGERQSYFLEKS